MSERSVKVIVKDEIGECSRDQVSRLWEAVDGRNAKFSHCSQDSCELVEKLRVEMLSSE